MILADVEVDTAEIELLLAVPVVVRVNTVIVMGDARFYIAYLGGRQTILGVAASDSNLAHAFVTTWATVLIDHRLCQRTIRILTLPSRHISRKRGGATILTQSFSQVFWKLCHPNLHNWSRLFWAPTCP